MTKIKMETVKKIAIIILCALLMGTCASNCSKQNTLREYAETVEQRDSLIIDLEDSIEYLNDSIYELLVNEKLLKEKNDLLGKSNKDLNSALGRKVVVNITNKNEEK